MAKLDTERLLDFIQRIIKNSPDEQTATLRLKQLLSIMKNMQGDQKKDVEMLEELVFNISYLKKDPEILEEVLKHLRTMRDTWKEVMRRNNQPVA